MSIYDDDVFRMACDQFQVIADFLSIDKNDRDRLMYPKRAVAVTLPALMDDGTTKTFLGYRVQHYLTIGPPKGWKLYALSLWLGDASDLVMCCICIYVLPNLPY